MISYILLHFNRPYLLDMNIKIIRKFISHPVQIIVADDGSDQAVLDKIKKFEIDDLYVQKNKNLNTWSEGTCSNTINSARKLSKYKYTCFSEDDFFFSPNPVDNVLIKETEIFQDSFYQTNTKNVFTDCLSILNANEKIKIIQLARDSREDRFPGIGNFSSNNFRWNFLDKKRKKNFYFSNWPYIIRTLDFAKIPIDKNKAIWSLESKMAKESDTIFGSSNYVLLPEKRFYVHVGAPFSKRLENFSGSEKRRNIILKIREKYLNNAPKGLEDFGKYLTKKWINKEFALDFDILLNKGLNECFNSAFKNIK